jgi:O-antigen ligase
MLALASLFTGHPMRFLRSPFAIPWLALLAWMGLASVTGLYIRGSLEFVGEYALRTHLAPFLFCSIVLISSHVTRLVYWMAGAMPVLLILCWRMGEFEDGRLGIPDTSLQNPNELAFVLLFVSAFVLMMLFSKSMVLKVVWLFVFAFTAYYTLQTASRANFLTLLVVALALIVAAPGRIRFALGALLPIVGVIVMAAAPAETLDRLKLLLPSAVITDELQARAAGSQEARLVLQKRALQLTLQNPVLGVGPRMFADAVDQMVREAEGRKSFWQEAHNTYLQVSAETGIPGLLMYCYCVFLCLKLNYRSYRANMNRPDRATIAGQSMCLFLASVVYAFGTLFNSVAYLVYFSMLIGLTAANYLAIQDLDQREKAQEQSAAPAA